MYSPTIRLFAVLELLQSYGQMSGTEIARRLEVNSRTVRRYITMLQDMGIPVEAERGPYGAYRLRRGYKLPPLMFNDAEAVALTLGLLAMRKWGFPVEVAAIEGALAKTERVMPERLLDQARALQEAISFNAPPSPVEVQGDYLMSLSTAVQQRARVKMRYAAWRGEETEREFDPYGIVFHEGFWYAAGYCHLRRDIRTFRLDRIRALELGGESFERPVDFDVLQTVLTSISMLPGTEQVELLMKTSMEVAQHITEKSLGTLEQTEEGIIYRRAANQLDWIAPMVISLPFPVVVIGPERLKEMIRQLGHRALELAGPERSAHIPQDQ